MNDPYTRKLQVMLNSARYLLAICVNILVLVLILYGVSRVAGIIFVMRFLER